MRNPYLPFQTQKFQLELLLSLVEKGEPIPSNPEVIALFKQVIEIIVTIQDMAMVQKGN